jgi:pimeloyl-ACP methyl ester carboxylesterase
MAERRQPTVVFVHGIWMTGLEFWRMRRHVARAGFATRRFRYRSVTRSIEQNARRLAEFVMGLGAEQVHLVCHSMGGLVALRALRDHPLPAGRVVLIGSPVRGSGVARHLVERRWLRWLVGRAAPEALVPETPVDWRVTRAVGVIAGTRGFGLGYVLGGLTQPSDGTVAVAETELPGASDTLHLERTHTTMLMAHETARQVVEFLRHGRFAR